MALYSGWGCVDCCGAPFAQFPCGPRKRVEGKRVPKRRAKNGTRHVEGAAKAAGNPLLAPTPHPPQSEDCMQIWIEPLPSRKWAV